VVVLALLLLGLVGMHALATASPTGGAHQLPSPAIGDSLMSPEHGAATDAATGAAEVDDLAAGSGLATNGEHDGDHALLVGCMFVLAGLVLTVLLGVLAHCHRRCHDAPRLSTQLGWPRQAEPPPRWPRISLRVLRV
jgi:hypothetical protein